MSRRYGVYPPLDMSCVFNCVNPGCLAKGRTFRAERDWEYAEVEKYVFSVWSGYVPGAFNCPECGVEGVEE